MGPSDHAPQTPELPPRWVGVSAPQALSFPCPELGDQRVGRFLRPPFGVRIRPHLPHEFVARHDFAGAFVQVGQQPELFVRERRLRLDTLNVDAPRLGIDAQSGGWRRFGCDRRPRRQQSSGPAKRAYRRRSSGTYVKS